MDENFAIRLLTQNFTIEEIKEVMFDLSEKRRLVADKFHVKISASYHDEFGMTLCQISIRDVSKSYYDRFTMVRTLAQLESHYV